MKIENGFENEELENEIIERNGNRNENLIKSCNLYKRFWCNGERINIINCANDPGAHLENKKYKMSDGTILNLVLLGSREHFQKLEQAINNIELRLYPIKQKLLNKNYLKAEQDAMKLEQDAMKLEQDAMKLEQDAMKAEKEADFEYLKAEQDAIKLEKELQQRIDELTFLQQNCPGPVDDDGDEDSEINAYESITNDEIFGEKDRLERFSSSAANESVLHVTSETFGRLKQLVVINHKSSEKILHKPVPRQYFIGPTLHRENKTYEVQNIELFTDLIYIGCIGKCESLMKDGGFSWLSFLQLLLVLLPILSRWRQMTHLKNMIHHNDLSSKLYHFIYSSIVILMGISITHSFDRSGETNTGNLFIGLHLLGGCLIDLFLGTCAVFFMPRFRFSLLIRMCANVLYVVPFLTLFGYPANDTDERFNLRLWIWGCGVLFENITPIIWLGLLTAFKSFWTDNRIAINIEHLSARHTLLVLIALGEFMVYLLGAGDFALGNPALELFNVMFAFMNALSLYYLYFRAETSSHHQHALRRNKWTGIFWGLLHVPVVVFIAVVSVCFYQIGKLAKAKNLSPLPFSLQSIFGTCYAALFFCFCAFSLIHLDADPQSNRQKVRPHIIRKGLRVVVNFIIGVLFLVLGLSVQISAQSWIYVSSGLCVFAAAVEEVGRIKK